MNLKYVVIAKHLLNYFWCDDITAQTARRDLKFEISAIIYDVLYALPLLHLLWNFVLFIWYQQKNRIF